jgi:hypothetical protein
LLQCCIIMATYTYEGVKNVVVIGSSGGGTATLGHTDAPRLLQTIHMQLQRCGAVLHSACFVALEGGKGMDAANVDTDTATAFLIASSYSSSSSSSSELTCFPWKRGSLRDVNRSIREMQDAKIATDISRGTIHGLICISCDPKLFRQTLLAAAKAHVPVTGSGGKSLSQAVSLYGITLSGNAGGSVATTSYSRAVSYTYALASHWKRCYGMENHETATISWTSVWNACLPVFWGVCLAKATLQNILYFVESNGFLQNLLTDISHGHTIVEDVCTLLRATIAALESRVLPTACAVIMATTNSSNSPQEHLPVSSLLMSSALASAFCWQSVVSGLIAGYLVRRLAPRVLFQCILANVPATMTNLVTTAGTGCAVAVLVAPLIPVLRQLSALIRWSIVASVVSLPVTISDSEFLTELIRALIGCIWGCFCCYGSKTGWYHSFFLPTVLIEMELGDPSFLGAIDVLTLVMVCAGICGGAIAARKLCDTVNVSECNLSEPDILLCWRALSINLACGDFIEACYPFMEKYSVINISGYFGSGISTAWLIANEPSFDKVARSSAYLPLPMSIALAGQAWRSMYRACAIAAGIPFFATLATFLAASKAKRG